MKKLLFPTMFASLVLAVSASAGTFKVSSATDKPVASVTMPDSWKPTAAGNTVVGYTPDGEVYMSVDAIDSADDVDEALKETDDVLKQSNVTIDESSKKVNKFKINDFDATEILFQGKLKDEPQGVSIVVVPIKGRALVITYWTSVAGEKEHQVEVGKIFNSIKAL